MSIQDPVFVLLVLFLVVGASELLVQKTPLKALGTALLSILLAAVLSNLGIIPTASDELPLYSGIFSYVAPLSIFFLLLEVNLSSLRKGALPLFTLFALGGIGTCLGVYAGITLIGGAETLGEQYNVLGGMFAATYTGGGLNFNAIAIEYNMQDHPVPFAAAVAVDNIITAVWMLATLGLPKVLRLISKDRPIKIDIGGEGKLPASPLPKGSVLELCSLLSLGFLALWVSHLMESFNIPSMLTLTAIALVLAQWKRVQRLHLSNTLGLFSMYLFLSVLGAYCDIESLVQAGELGWNLLLLTGSILAVHGILIFGVGQFFFKDWDLIAVASQANIGGSSSALALTEALGRKDLLLPSILAGSIGNAVGTFLGFSLVGIL